MAPFPFFADDFAVFFPFADDEASVFALFGDRLDFGESPTPASVEDRFVPYTPNVRGCFKLFDASNALPAMIVVEV